MCSLKNVWQTQIWTISQSQNSYRKINRLWTISNQFWRWSGYISMPNFRPFLPCVLLWICGTTKFDQSPRIWSVRKVVRIHQHAKFQVIPCMHSLQNVRNSKLEPFHKVFLARVTLKFADDIEKVICCFCFILQGKKFHEFEWKLQEISSREMRWTDRHGVFVAACCC